VCHCSLLVVRGASAVWVICCSSLIVRKHDCVRFHCAHQWCWLNQCMLLVEKKILFEHSCEVSPFELDRRIHECCFLS